MKIGVFDSGVGGLLLMHSLNTALPEYDYIYLGDTARVPYGNRSQGIVYQFTEEAVAYLLAQGCQLIIIACNTASAEALRKIQQDYLPQHYPNRRVLGVIIPTAEAAVKKTESNAIGVLATKSTVHSQAYLREIHKLNSHVTVAQQAAPLLVPLIENDGLQWVEPILDTYLAPLLSSSIGCLILGCTHYPRLKTIIRDRVGPHVTVISQDEVIPAKLKDYLARHPEIEQGLAKNHERHFYVTDLTPTIESLGTELYGNPITFHLASLSEQSALV